MRARISTLAGAVALVGAAGAMALPAMSQNASPQLLILSCAGCHGANGRSAGVIPSLNGRTAEQIAQAMREFRGDQRPATIMNRIAKGYTDAEIDALAREMATQWRAAGGRR